MTDRNPLAYTGRVSATTKRQGDCQFDSTDFTVTDGVVSLSGTGAVENLTAQSGTVTPSSGQLALAGATGQMSTSGSGSTITFTLDEGIPRTADVSLTSAQVKALAATQIELVAAPGAGKAIHFMGALLKLTYGGTNAFTEAGDNLGIKYTDDSGVQVSSTIETTSFITATANTYTSAIPAGDAIVAATGAENQALVLDNLGSEIGGNAANDNTLEVSVIYRIVEV